MVAESESSMALGRSNRWKNGTPPTWVLLCALLMIQAGFGLYPVVVKMFAKQQQETANVYIFSLYRSAIAIPVLFLSSVILEGRIFLPDLRMTFVFLSLGFVGTFCRQYSYITAVFAIGPDLSSVFKSLTPVVTIVLAVLMFTEKVPSLLMMHTWTKFIGILVTVGGAIKLTLLSFETTEDSIANADKDTDQQLGTEFTGYVAMVVNILSGALLCIIQRKFIFTKTKCKWKDYPLAVTAYSYTFGVAFMILFSLSYVFTGDLEQFTLPQNCLYALIYAVLVTSTMCYSLIAWTNKHLMPSLVNAFIPLQIPITVTAEYLVFGDQLTIAQYIMTVLIIIGVLIVLFSKHMEDNPSRYGWRIDDYYLKFKEMSRYLPQTKPGGRFSVTHHAKLSISTAL